MRTLVRREFEPGENMITFEGGRAILREYRVELEGMTEERFHE